MTKYFKQFLWLLFAFIIAGGLFLPSFTYAESGSGTPLSEDNQYLFSDTIVVNTPAMKDLIAIGENVTINAPVYGDLQIAARTVSVNAPVYGDLRVAAAEIDLKNTHVGEDMVLAGGTVQADEKTSSSGATMIFAGNTNFLGNTEKSLLIKGSEITLGGIHNADVTLSAALVHLRDTLKISKNLTYSTNSTVEVKEGMVAGQIVKNDYQLTESSVWDRVFEAISLFCSLFLAIVLVTWVFPAAFMKRINIMKSETLSCFIRGFLGAIFTPLLLLILLFTIVGVPLILSLLFLYGAIVIFSPIIATMYIGSLLFTKDSMERPYLLLMALTGACIVTLILQIPVIGAFIVILLSTVGIGSIMKRAK